MVRDHDYAGGPRKLRDLRWAGAGRVIPQPAEDDDTGRPDRTSITKSTGSGGAFLQMPGGGSLNPSTREGGDRGQEMQLLFTKGGTARQVFKFGRAEADRRPA